MENVFIKKIRKSLKGIFCGCNKGPKPTLVIDPEVKDIVKRGSVGAVGFDLPALRIVKSSTGEKEFPITLEKDDWVLLDTGVKWETSLEGTWLYELQVRPRSGFSTKNSMVVTNSPGTVDPDYTGSIMVHLTKVGYSTNPDTNLYTVIHKYERIAQAVISHVLVAPGIRYDIQTENFTERGSGGFGHTGK